MKKKTVAFGIRLSFLKFCMLLGLFSPQQSLAQFSYNYPTGVVINDDKEFCLPDSIESFAKEQFHYLDQSPFFDTSFITNSRSVRKYHLKKKHDKHNNGEILNIETKDGINIPCTYFNRNSDTLLIVAGGFTNEREKMTPFVHMFENYDIVLFDFRGHGYKDFSWIDPRTWTYNFTKLAFGVTPSLVSFGLNEGEDVRTVVNYFRMVNCFKNKKTYTSVNGLGICYGAFILLKAAAEYPGLFNKLILDGCWLSLDKFVQKLKKDPKLIFSPQKGGWSKHCFFGNKRIVTSLDFICHRLMGLKFHAQVVLTNHLSKLDPDLSVLYFYGKDDLVVARDEFETIWQAINVTEKTAIITSVEHVRNHIKQKELYKLVCDLFLEGDQKTLSSCFSDSNFLRQHYAQKILPG